MRAFAMGIIVPLTASARSDRGPGRAGTVLPASPARGGGCAQVHLKNVLLTLSGAVLGQPECYIRYEKDLIADDGSIANESTRKFLAGYVDRFVAFVTALAKR
jgi:chromate reductase